MSNGTKVIATCCTFANGEKNAIWNWFQYRDRDTNIRILNLKIIEKNSIAIKLSQEGCQKNHNLFLHGTKTFILTTKLQKNCNVTKIQLIYWQ
jgi:hypothetical protein